MMMIRTVLQNNLELDQFENQYDIVCTNISFYDRKATEAGETVFGGNNCTLKLKSKKMLHLL